MDDGVQSRAMPSAMPTRRLGRTEHHSSHAILGGAAFGRSDQADSEAAFELALDSGVNHIDIAPSYGNAELAVGALVGANRSRLFVGEKTGRKNPDGVRAEMETSLQRLGCDYFDLYQIHGVTDLDDLETRTRAFEAILRARDEGLTRFVGITGHNLGTPVAQRTAVERYDLDTVLFPVYAGVMSNPQYAEDAAALLAECARRDVGVMAIKAVAHRPWQDRDKTADTWYEPFFDEASIERGVRYTLSTPGVHALCAAGDLKVLPKVLAAAAAFVPMDADERAGVTADAAEWDTIFPLAEHAR